MKVSVLMNRNQIKRTILKIKRTKKNQNPNNNKKIKKNKSNLLNKSKRNKKNNRSNNKKNRSSNNKAIKISNSLKHQLFKMILTRYNRTIEQMLNHKWKKHNISLQNGIKRGILKVQIQVNPLLLLPGRESSQYSKECLSSSSDDMINANFIVYKLIFSPRCLKS